jgi:multisubunit Na+/H+ antiporter MnhE subunit
MIAGSPSPADLAIWTAAALPLWLLLTATLDRLGSPAPAVLAAAVSWVLARLLMSTSELVRWATDVLAASG